MKLKKSEKKLLQFFATVVMFAVILKVFVLPEAERKVELDALYEELDAELFEKQRLMTDVTLDERYEEADKLAKQNYEYFYAMLNGYSIDEIINGIALKNQLGITNLNIGEYERAADDFVVETGQTLEVLVRSVINVTVQGGYEDILQFMDEVNEKSQCLRMNLVAVQKNNNDATGMREYTATFRIYLYGIGVETEEESPAQEETENSME